VLGRGYRPSLTAKPSLTMPVVGQEIDGFGGMRLRFDRIDPDLLEMEASYTGEAGMPPEHLHPSQTERFEIVEGSMRTIVDGEGPGSARELGERFFDEYADEFRLT
jgi:hypothetical protein